MPPDPPVEGPGPDPDAPASYPHRGRDAAWVEAARGGDPEAFGRLYDAWFDPCYDVARRIVRDPEVAAEVAQDAFLAAWRNLDGLADPAAFGGWILRISRNQAFNRQRKERRSVAVDDEGMAMIAGTGRTPGTGDQGPAGFGVTDRVGTLDDPARLVEDAEAVALLWGAVDGLAQRDAEVLDLQLRHGLSPAEIGDVLGMNRNAANQLVHRVRGRLDGAVRSRLLWHAGTPTCEVLAEVLDQAGITTYGPDAHKTITSHAKSCDRCQEQQKTRLAPATLFAAVPVAAPIVLKQQAAAALDAAGVPMQGSTMVGTGGAGGGGAAVTAVHAATPPPSPTPTRTRQLALAAVAAAVLVLVGVLVLVTRQDGAEQVAAGPAATSTTTSTEPSSSSTTERRRGTTSSPTTSAPASSTTSSSTNPTTSTSTSTTSTSTTSSTTTSTTTPRKPQLRIAVTPSTIITPWSAGSGPRVAWQVIDGEGLTVRVHGPDKTDPDATIGTASSGTVEVCPNGPVISGTCLAKTGQYVYQVDLLDGTEVVTSANATLSVTTPPIG